MGSKFLIDSNVVIDFLAGNLPKTGIATLRKAVDEAPVVSVITKIEVLSFKSTPTVQKLLASFLNESIVLGLNDAVVDQAIKIRRSTRISTPDALIAATSQVYNLKLVTRNLKDFSKVKDLMIINPWDI